MRRCDMAKKITKREKEIKLQKNYKPIIKVHNCVADMFESVKAIKINMKGLEEIVDLNPEEIKNRNDPSLLDLYYETMERYTNMELLKNSLNGMSKSMFNSVVFECRDLSFVDEQINNVLKEMTQKEASQFFVDLYKTIPYDLMTVCSNTIEIVSGQDTEINSIIVIDKQHMFMKEAMPLDRGDSMMSSDRGESMFSCYGMHAPDDSHHINKEVLEQQKLNGRKPVGKWEPRIALLTYLEPHPGIEGQQLFNINTTPGMHTHVMSAYNNDREKVGKVLEGDARYMLMIIARLLYILNCSNVTTRIIKPPKALNKSRVKKRKVPFFSYHTLDLYPSEENSVSTGGGGGIKGHTKRLHMRRGHIRRYKKTGKTIWINNMMVGNKKDGYVHKDYRV